MCQHILLAVPLQCWDKPGPHALPARDAAVALAKGAGTRLSMLSVYEYEDRDVPDLAAGWALNRIEVAGNTWRHALNRLAVVVPEDKVFNQG